MEKIIQNNVEIKTTSPLVIEEGFVCDDIVEETKMDVSAVLERGNRVKAYTLEEFQKYGKSDMERFVEKLKKVGVKTLDIEDLNTGKIIRESVPTSLRGEVKFQTYLRWYTKAVGLEESSTLGIVLDHFLQHVCGVERNKVRELKTAYTLEEFQKYGKEDMERFVETLQKEGIDIVGIKNLSVGLHTKYVTTFIRGDVQFGTYLKWYKKAEGLEESSTLGVVLDHFLQHVCGVERNKVLEFKTVYTLEEFQRYGKADMFSFVEKLKKDGIKILGIEDLDTGQRVKYVPTSIRGDVKFETYLRWYKKAEGLEESSTLGVVLDHFLQHVCGVERNKVREFKTVYTLEEFQKYGKSDMERFVEKLKKDGVKILGIEDLNIGMVEKHVPTSIRGDVQFVTYLNWYKKAVGLEEYTQAHALTHMKLTLLSSASQADRRELVGLIDSSDEEYL